MRTYIIDTSYYGTIARIHVRSIVDIAPYEISRDVFYLGVFSWFYLLERETERNRRSDGERQRGRETERARPLRIESGRVRVCVKERDRKNKFRIASTLNDTQNIFLNIKKNFYCYFYYMHT